MMSIGVVRTLSADITISLIQSLHFFLHLDYTGINRDDVGLYIEKKMMRTRKELYVKFNFTSVYEWTR